MNNTDNLNLSSWERIQNGVKDIERCIGQKKYNMAMVKARQTLEYMVKCLCERTGTMEGSLIDMIDTLYEDGIISKTTCEHYHKIRMIGNKAIHEDDHNAYNANQAYHLLSQEVYTFANDYKEHRRKAAAPRRSPASETSGSRNRDSSAYVSERTSQRRRSSGSRSSRASSGNRRRTSRSSIDLETILKPLLLVAIIIVLIFIIKMIRPAEENPEETAAAVITSEEVPTESDTQAATEAPAETDAPATEPSPSESADTPSASSSHYKTTDILNVRSTPSTDRERIGVLNAGAKVEYIRDHDEKWAVIRFNGSEAYVVKEYLTTEN